MKTGIVLSFIIILGVTSILPESHAAAGDGTGLLGEYFNNPDLTAPVFSRLDPNIDFNWGEAAPGPGIDADTFSVRWTGWVKPRFSETYTFYANTDDGVRVWLNGVLILDNWVDQPPTTVSSIPVTLTAENAATLRVHYYDNLYGAVAHLYWSSASQPLEIIPQSRLYPPNLSTNHPPRAPTITEPSTDNQLLNPSDVHMETALFSDPDPGDTHVCSDFEIWTVSPAERAWVTSCIGGIEKVHTHLGDGVFENSHAGRTSLFHDTNYKLRIRHKDSSGDPLTEWSPWTERPFRTVAQVNPNTNAPGWILNDPGYNVRVVATGFQLPVNIAFVPNPGTSPGSPFYYVTELYGTIKVVTRSGQVRVYASNLLNFNPTGAFPGSGEQGLTGIAVDPNSGDIFAAMLYDPDGIDGEPHYSKVVRFHSTDGGLTAASQTTILAMPGEPQGQSHQISNVSIGPDGKLYVHMGDGFDYTTSMNTNSFRGKILRMELDGRPVTTNPFYRASNGTNAQDYIYAYGFRNPFGGDWRATDGFHYEVENGPNVDRFAKVFSGRNYGFNDTDASMSTFALYNWSPAVAPVNLVFIQQSRFGGSGFPSSKWDHAFVTESGPTWADGPQERGKRISEFVLSAAGARLSGPTPFITYNGTGKATVAALAAGPDGLYFSDLYPDQNFGTPVSGGANILRIGFGPGTPNVPPVVNLYSPTNGSVFTAPTNLVLSATPTDDDGIAKVEFYAGSQKLGEILSAPFLFTWTNVASGNYALTARAMDPSGLWGTSAVVNVEVRNLPGIRLRDPLRTANGVPTFTVESGTGIVCYVELSTNLVNWTPIFTNQPSVSPWTFKDAVTNRASRFYRGRYK
jgi:glucose/arabinose dehydrogenase